MQICLRKTIWLSLTLLFTATQFACLPPDTDGEQTGPSLTGQLPTLDDEELADGWISLFDGQTFFGWREACEADWRIEEGAILVSQGEVGLLHTHTQFDNYILRVDFRADKGTNSGIFLRTPPESQDPAADCYELNIAPPDNPFPTGSLVKRQKAAGTYDSTDWQTYEVTVDGGRITVLLNGEQILDFIDPRPLGRGYIGLQHNEGRVAFRNIRLKPLGLPPIFNGQDLTGWKSHAESESEFTVTDEGQLNVTGGRGQLESEAEYGDFILQLQCITHADNLNSGIFLRCIPGSMMDGYESQIHNGFADGDRTKPIDCGTGGIFHRADARYVAADDQKWFYKTIIAEGPHIAVWVNGLQVTDLTDRRRRDPNPRNGLRMEPGTIQIQGHDPTTNISFRNLHAREMMERR